MTRTSSESGGTFEYMLGSHVDKMPKNKKFDYSLEEDDVFANYGKKRHFSPNTRLGDVLFANTLGVHRGTKPIEEDRIVMFVNYGMVPEYGNKMSGISILKETYDSLSERQKRAAKYLHVA